MAISEKHSCEVLVDGPWTLMPVAQAHTLHRDAGKRYPHCHGGVVTKGAYSPRRGAFVYHHRVHNGCPGISQQYVGTPKPHLEALT
jgi:hypothetical protein